ncbi:MAG: protein-L-isoaspartate(D-aspartate) O-methyltransferase [Gemmatimonadota bacterium]
MAGNVEPEFRGVRRRLVESLQDKGIRDLAVLRAIDQVPRHLFVPPDVRHRAYEDSALPIGSGQTISQPYVHARAIEQLMLTGREKVLEIGTGSAYQTALLSQLADQVFSIERYAGLLDRARTLLSQAQVRNVSVSLGDGTLGWREYAPYDAIVVSAGAPHVPPALESQLAEGGRLLIPIGDRDEQMLTLFIKRGERMERRDIVPVRFVPLIGAGGWPA